MVVAAAAVDVGDVVDEEKSIRPQQKRQDETTLKCALRRGSEGGRRPFQMEVSDRDPDEKMDSVDEAVATSIRDDGQPLRRLQRRRRLPKDAIQPKRQSKTDDLNPCRPNSAMFRTTQIKIRHVPLKTNHKK